MEIELNITKNDKRKTALDHSALFSVGIEHVRKLASEIWTDYNAHDPGVTALEVLSYALTDLSFRAELHRLWFSENGSIINRANGDEPTSRDHQSDLMSGHLQWP